MQIRTKDGDLWKLMVGGFLWFAALMSLVLWQAGYFPALPVGKGGLAKVAKKEAAMKFDGEPFLLYRKDESPIWVVVNSKQKTVRGLAPDGAEQWQTNGGDFLSSASLGGCDVSLRRMLCKDGNKLLELDLEKGAWREANWHPADWPEEIDTNLYSMGADGSRMFMAYDDGGPNGYPGWVLALVSDSGELISVLKTKSISQLGPAPAVWSLDYHAINQHGAVLSKSEEDLLILLDGSQKELVPAKLNGVLLGIAGRFVAVNQEGRHKLLNLSGEVQAEGEAAGLVLEGTRPETKGFFRVEGSRIERYDIEMKSLWSVDVPDVQVDKEGLAKHPGSLGHHPARQCGETLLVPTGRDVVALEPGTGKLKWQKQDRTIAGCLGDSAVLSSPRGLEAVDPANGEPKWVLREFVSRWTAEGLLVKRSDGTWELYR